MHLSYPPNLPVSERRETIIEALREHQVLIVIGDTGSGKTTQLPKMCLEAGRGSAGLIACTQPRRIAAVAVAERLGQELRAQELVGYKIRFQDHSSESTLIKFMTDGVLLAETRQDRKLLRYDTLIVDEAHERSLNIDFLLGYLKNLLPLRPDLKVIVSSATMDAEKFSRHFQQAPVIEVSGRGYPITTLYRAAETDEEEQEASYVEQAIAAVEELVLQPEDGDILVFMPTERDINDTLDGLRDRFEQSHLLLPLFGRMAGADQRRIFRPEKKRKIIVATNVAETSITVPGIRFVVDSGLARIARYNPRSGTTSLQVSRISQASCEQRRGRCGRTGPGICIRLYSEEDFLSRPAFTPPEIQRSNLAEVILQMISLNLGEPADFPFLDPPPGNAIRDGFRILQELGALGGRSEGKQHLTARGRLMARLPLDPRISRIILEGQALGVGAESLVLAAALSIQDPRVRPLDMEHKADEAHRQFIDRQSDFLTLLNIWNRFFDDPAPPSKSRLSRFCKTNFLSWQRMREWMDVHEQIAQLLRERKVMSADASTEQRDDSRYVPVHRALCSGFLRNICRKKEKNSYQATSNREVVLFPGSGLYNKGPEWAIAAEFVETTQLFARTVAAIDPDWLEELGGDLCKRSWAEPHWEKKSGQVVALERVTLFGLVIVPGRRVNYGRINSQTMAESQEIFIRAALVEGQLGGAYPFLDRNLALIKKFHEMEERYRRRDIVVDEERLVRFYAERLNKVYDRFTLNRLLRRKGDDRFLYMQEADICRTEPQGDALYHYPASLRVGDMDLALRYLFDPGHEEDGVTVLLPRDLTEHINPQIFEWLVPGLLPEKVLMLCKRLPGQIRRRLVPLPDARDRILDSIEIGRGSLYQEMERAIFRGWQIRVQAGDWRPETLPAHLRMRFLLLDASGQPLRASRSFAEISQMARANIKAKTKNNDQPRPMQQSTRPPERVVSKDDLDQIERKWPVYDDAGQLSGLLFATLEPLAPSGEKNCLKLSWLPDETASRKTNRLALQWLYGRMFPKEMGTLTKLCKAAVTNHSASWLSLGSGLGASDLRLALQAFLLDALFDTREGELPTSARFDEIAALAGKQGIVRQAGQYLEAIEHILRKRRAIAQQINDWVRRSQKNRNYDHARHQDYLQTLEQIAPRDMLFSLRAEELGKRPRYLQALGLRIERAEHSPMKDEAKTERLRKALVRLGEMGYFSMPSAACLRCQEEYRDMVEEFRVSVFAPELGTAQPVSEQRLRQKWTEVENLCRQME